MNVRLLNSADAEIYRTIRLQSLQEHPEAFLSSYEAEKDMPIETTQSRLTLSEEHFTLGGFTENGELVGVVTFVRESRSKIRHKGNVVAMYVDQKARGQRVGYALMKELITRAEQLPGLEILNLSVVSSNVPAKKLYESLGFILYGTERNAMKLEDSYLDEDFMSLELNLYKGKNL
ncbi:GNAT family N-acetyltransferase [Paenibacillus sp. FSL K6-0276]|uniref:GNAT family N-acetyltransferase n=1 Tax=Paenibacillus sp. FSL K6-0276 TaxID=2921450 RepID=UPI0030EBF129